jgi:betaine-homocysteine S-methyltransferase
MRATLADAGADVVGLNCTRGPDTMMPMLKQVRAAVKVHVARCRCPTGRTTASRRSSRCAITHGMATGARGRSRSALDPFTCNRFEIADFGREALALGVRYLGVCCGAGPHHIRALAESVGKQSAGVEYSADMSKHAFLGSHERLKQVQKEYADKLVGRSIPVRAAEYPPGIG